MLEENSSLSDNVVMFQQIFFEIIRRAHAVPVLKGRVEKDSCVVDLADLVMGEIGKRQPDSLLATNDLFASRAVDVSR